MSDNPVDVIEAAIAQHSPGGFFLAKKTAPALAALGTLEDGMCVLGNPNKISVRSPSRTCAPLQYLARLPL